jgi:hypothetical protein
MMTNDKLVFLFCLLGVWYNLFIINVLAIIPLRCEW